MDAIRRVTNVDLRDAKEHQFALSVVANDREICKSAYSLQKFSSHAWESEGESRRLCINIHGFSDIMAPHSIDVPRSEIEKIELVIRGQRCFFNNIDEASFFFYGHMLSWPALVRMYVYLRKGILRQSCNVVWRCYFLDRTSRDILWDTSRTTALQLPVSKNLMFDTLRCEVYTRKMAKL